MIPPMVVRLLRSMSNKPFNTAKKNSHGFIEPVVHYFAPEKQKDKLDNIVDKVEKTKNWLSSKLNPDHVDVINVPALEAESEYENKVSNKQILDAEYLLTKQLESLEKDPTRMKSSQIISKISDPVLEVEEVGSCRGTKLKNPTAAAGSSSTKPNPEISIPDPLHPLYQPSQHVPRVWSSSHTTERLYRYTHIEGIIYPPGYIP